MTEYRPTFVFWTSLLAQVPLQLFFSVWAGGFLGGLLGVILPSTGGLIVTPFLTIGLGVFVLFPVITLTLKRLNYANTSYRVFPDCIEVDEGFLSKSSKEIRISAIREVNLRRGVLQRLVGLGSVYVATQATGQGMWQTQSLLGGGSTFASGLMLLDLTNSEEAYQKLLALVGSAATTR